MPKDAKALSEQLSQATDVTGMLVDPVSSAVAGDRALVRDRLRQVFADTDPMHAGYAIAATLLHYGSLGTHIPGQPSDIQRYAEAWAYRDVGTPVQLGDYLIHTLQSYDAGGYPPSDRVSAALVECNQLSMTRGLTGALRPVSAGEVFNCAAVHAALSDPEASAEFQVIIEAIPDEDWPARSLLARSYWPAASRWPVASRLSVAGDTPR